MSQNGAMKREREREKERERERKIASERPENKSKFGGIVGCLH